MGDIGVDPGGPAFDQGHRGIAQRSRRIDDIVDQDAATPRDIADDVHHLGNTGALAAFVDDREVGVEASGDVPGAHHAPDIGGDDDEFLPGVTISNVLHQNRRGEQVIGRDVEEALDLAGVEIEGQHSVGAGCGNHVRDELGRDRGARA